MSARDGFCHPTWWRFGDGPWIPNVLCREGEYFILDAWFRGNPVSTPVGFEIGLTSATITSLSTALELAGEPQGGGYQRQRLDRSALAFPTLAVPSALPNDPYRVQSAAVTFQAGLTPISPFSTAFLCALLQLGTDPSVLTRALVSAATTGTTTNIPAGNQLDVTIALNLGSS